jgi:hypothetical protein
LRRKPAFGLFELRFAEARVPATELHVLRIFVSELNRFGVFARAQSCVATPTTRRQRNNAGCSTQK